MEPTWKQDNVRILFIWFLSSSINSGRQSVALPRWRLMNCVDSRLESHQPQSFSCSSHGTWARAEQMREIKKQEWREEVEGERRKLTACMLSPHDNSLAGFANSGVES